MNFALAESYILHRLHTELPPLLYYHGVHHTLDVVQAAMALAAAEGVTDQTALLLLRTAALYHDTGFLHAFEGHEAVGCALARGVLPSFGYTADQVQTVCTLIMATRLPQEPHSHLAEILCDADLDYLGRPDYGAIVDTLFQEFQARQLVTADEVAWNSTQEQFLSAHHYWTATAVAWREAGKQRHLAGIRQQLAAASGQ